MLVLGLPDDDELLVQALAVAKVRAAATAAVPHRMALVLAHFAFIAFMLRFTCSYLLIKENWRCSLLALSMSTECSGREVQNGPSLSGRKSQLYRLSVVR